jgi:predicted amidophosphoribosyltransferase
MRLPDLRRAYQEFQVEGILQRLKGGDFAALLDLERIGVDKIPAAWKDEVAKASYEGAKVSLQQVNLDGAVRRFSIAHCLDPKNWLYTERLRLARSAPRRDSLAWKLSLHDLQRDCGLLCKRSVCTCTTHFQILCCQKGIGTGFDHRTELSGVPVNTVGAYHAYTKSTRWTKLLIEVKHNNNYRLLEPMAAVVADFVLETTTLMRHVDVLAPVPPDPVKFVNRGFAPNDILARHLSSRLALPVVFAINRKGGQTRQASWGELEAQFEVTDRRPQSVRGLSVLLIEDIWTWGRTIPICAGKLKSSGAKEVYAVALGKSMH